MTKSLNDLAEIFTFFEVLNFYNERQKMIKEENIADGNCGGHIP